MKRKRKMIILFLFLAIAATSYSQGLYSDEGNQNSLFGEPTSKEGPVLRGERPDQEGNYGEAQVVEGAPIGEGILLLIFLAGGYLLIGHKTKRTR
jgi:hypothetical protein